MTYEECECSKGLLDSFLWHMQFKFHEGFIFTSQEVDNHYGFTIHTGPMGLKSHYIWEFTGHFLLCFPFLVSLVAKYQAMQTLKNK